MLRVPFVVVAAALSLTVLEVPESRAQKGTVPASSHPAPHISGSPSVRPVFVPNPTSKAANYAPAVFTPKLAQPGSAPLYRAAMHNGSWNAYVPWHQNASDYGGWYPHRRDLHDHNFYAASLLYFNPWAGGFFNSSPLYPQYYYYYYGANYPPNRQDPTPSVTYHNAYGPLGSIIPANQNVDSTAHMEVVVPDARANVWFSDYQTSSQGTMRFFTSPALQPGVAYSYTIRATWDEGGQAKSAERVVYVTAGSRVVVDFTAMSEK